MKLHLGCGRTIMPGWVNLDLVAGDGVDCVADLDDVVDNPLPFDGDTFDEILGLHLIEHLRNPLEFMQEMHRVAKDGASITFATPYGSSDDAWEDPTHVRPYFVGSWSVFSQGYYWRADYGYRGDWIVEDITVDVAEGRYADVSPAVIMQDLMSLRNVGLQMTATLVAVKPTREPAQGIDPQPRLRFALGS